MSVASTACVALITSVLLSYVGLNTIEDDEYVDMSVTSTVRDILISEELEEVDIDQVDKCVMIPDPLQDVYSRVEFGTYNTLSVDE
jgi:hypothetical protein